MNDAREGRERSAARARGAIRLQAAQREEEKDAQGTKLRHLTDVNRNGAAYLQALQVSASVRRVEGGGRREA